ncbi:PocR ligand-binding domain-containing protein [Aminipila terrae]|uniref:Histidine kinase n=1 Tax=Aminipila terrae TaxID=2697030 RepID=A0A6P1MJR5_9FIRM|nr:PocR ligand-binding domain-containing protein [Aminipila terrae]QHI71255.1 hypothetical protein Ami3637_01560 [Aminipila terrae]
MEIIKSIYDIVDIDALQEMQDNFAEAVGMAFIAVDYKGNPVTKQSGFTEFCARGRKYPEFMGLCYQCDAHGGLHAAISGKPHIYICHAGLIDFAVPLMYEGDYYGAIMGGQISTNYEDADTERELEKVIDRKSNWKDKSELVETYTKVRSISFNRIEAVVTLMFEHACSLMEQGHLKRVREELELKSSEVLEEKSRRVELEKSLRENQQCISTGALKSVSLFSSLSVISRLAYIEDAKKTENAIYVLSDMLRYTSEKRNSQISTLGEELTYVENYLKMQRIRLEDRLRYEIDVEEDFYSVACPYMMIQPIVENSVEYAVEPRKEGGIIKITCLQKGGDLVVSIEDNGFGISRDTIENIINEDFAMMAEIDRYDLYNINKSLIGLFGKKYRLIIENVPDGTGTIVKLKLPVKSNLVK